MCVISVLFFPFSSYLHPDANCEGRGRDLMVLGQKKKKKKQLCD